MKTLNTNDDTVTVAEWLEAGILAFYMNPATLATITDAAQHQAPAHTVGEVIAHGIMAFFLQPAVLEAIIEAAHHAEAVELVGVPQNDGF